MTAVRVRPAAVAGLFYPDVPGELRAWVQAALDAAAVDVPPGAPVPKALVAPHAGYRYSGAVAAAAWARLVPAADRVRRVVLAGPTHRVAVDGIAVPTVDAVATPLGQVAVDAAARDALAGLPGVVLDDRPHHQEHSLEVHLPFLQVALPGATVLPLAVGRASATTVADVLERVWGGDETVVVVSSDLSHYHPYDEAQQLDAATIEAFLALDVEGLEPGRACGAMPARGLLELARRRHLGIALLDACNSADTAGDASRVVGYASFGLWDGPAPPPPWGARERSALLAVAREALADGVPAGRPPGVRLAGLPPALRAPGAAFVTLRQDGALRGCIGTLRARRPLAVDVAVNAVHAGLHDRRFPPVTPDEVAGLEVHVSVLSPPIPFPCGGYDELAGLLVPGRDGLVVEDGDRRATFLPSVWEQLPDPADFVARLWAKAGLPARHWSAATRVARYEAREA